MKKRKSIDPDQWPTFDSQKWENNLELIRSYSQLYLLKTKYLKENGWKLIGLWITYLFILFNSSFLFAGSLVILVFAIFFSISWHHWHCQCNQYKKVINEIKQSLFHIN